jgi:hypothetical protein
MASGAMKQAGLFVGDGMPAIKVLFPKKFHSACCFPCGAFYSSLRLNSLK